MLAGVLPVSGAAVLYGGIWLRTHGVSRAQAFAVVADAAPGHPDSDAYSAAVYHLLQPEDAIRVFDPILLEDYVIPEDMSGLSVNLRFGSSNVITGTNKFKNF